MVSLLAQYQTTCSDNYIPASHPNYLENCANLQTAFDIAIQAHEEGIKTLTLVPMKLPFHQKDLVHCRRNYELKHPGIFQETPAIITGKKEGLIQIIIMSRQEADDLMKNHK